MGEGCQMLLSVVVCTYNRSWLLNHALESLARQTLDPLLMEVVVVDNNSTDDTQDVARRWKNRFAHCQILFEERQGLSHARNSGWRLARGEYVAFMDDDAKAASDWAERLIQAFRQVRPMPASVGGPIVPWYDSRPPSWFSDVFEIRSWGDAAGFLPPSRARYGFSGSNMAFSRRTLEQLGGFRPDYGMVGGVVRLGEETDLFLRLHALEPYFWYDPGAIVSHFVSSKNMQLSTRLLRRFRSGKTRAALDRRRICSIDDAQELRVLVSLIGQMVRILGPARTSRKVLLAECLQKLCYQCGYLSW